VLDSMVLSNIDETALPNPDVSVSLNFSTVFPLSAPPAPALSPSRRGLKKSVEPPLHQCARLNLHRHLETILSLPRWQPTNQDFADSLKMLETISGKGMTPLGLAAQKGSLECVKILVKAGAKINDHPPNGSTPLIQAAHFGHEEICAFLIEHGAHVDKPNGKGTTALMRASQEGNFTIVKLLVRMGASVNCVNM
jgi:ankyrin repeat protein